MTVLQRISICETVFLLYCNALYFSFYKYRDEVRELGTLEVPGHLEEFELQILKEIACLFYTEEVDHIVLAISTFRLSSSCLIPKYIFFDLVYATEEYGKSPKLIDEYFRGCTCEVCTNDKR